MLEAWNQSYLAGGNAPYLESLYESYLDNPGSVNDHWRQFFDDVSQHQSDISHEQIRQHFKQLVRQFSGHGTSQVSQAPARDDKQIRVLQLINAYRFRGHQRAHFDVLGLQAPPEIPDLNLSYHNFSQQDLGRVFDTGSLVGPDRAPLRDIIATLEHVYCGDIGAEYMHITDTQEKRWLQERLEQGWASHQTDNQTRLHLLERLTAAEGLERFLHSKYVGQKRFSLEGAESLIPLLDTVIQASSRHDVQELVFGMAHRGRLNVLVNIMGKQPADLFREFEGRQDDSNRSGDVKYHKGFSSDIGVDDGVMHVALAFNPSHLEIVGPVVEGAVRARQHRLSDAEGDQVVAVVIHGDAAFAGQGVIMETFSMSQSRGYSTHGTVHIVINNQIGFTSSNQQDTRSSLYCTDVAKMVSAPIFHVNGDDPEAVHFIAKLAVDYRMHFKKDVVIDMVCYRRHGHSEADEPTVTQPMMYQRIRELGSTRKHYADRLIEDELISEQQVQALAENYRAKLDAAEIVAPNLLDKKASNYEFRSEWYSYIKGEVSDKTKTSVPVKTLRKLTTKLLHIPKGFVLHHNVAKILDNRRKMAAGAVPVDWGFAETVAYASLMQDGYAIRLSGQDSGRGTFFHRHAVLYNQEDGSNYIPLRSLSSKQADFTVINSLLSEEAVLAFEYGYSTTDPNTLTIWEAQFGDFANNAQVVIDQFISAGEQKWSRLTGLVMFLPHGYEGQGPEHSSARPERYLQLCAEHNMQVCIPSTPAQVFHLLRRQMLCATRKPLIAFMPKSLLRHRLAVSQLDELSKGRFHPVIPEVDDLDNAAVTRVVLCSGKVYYDLLEKRRKDERTDVAIIRMEQLYPFPDDHLKKQLGLYPNIRSYIWCQEEPKNQGSWFTSQHHVRALLPDDAYLCYAGRPTSAAPAVGYTALHVQQQKELVEDALGPPADNKST
ncbi:MAG: 2-oxoglutarate dehydrogenase E1 component [Proteobacteria bacterium]|nr:2-oxoglutarate dehydrogenase E1 component [Pseudomonadota bacterium]